MIHIIDNSSLTKWHHTGIREHLLYNNTDKVDSVLIFNTNIFLNVHMKIYTQMYRSKIMLTQMPSILHHRL